MFFHVTVYEAGSYDERVAEILMLAGGVSAAALIATAAYFFSAAYAMPLLGLYEIPSSAVVSALVAVLAWRVERSAKVRVYWGIRG